MDAAAIERFWARVDKSGGAAACWIWRGYRQRFGHGQIGVDGGYRYAHRISWELATGQSAAGKVIRHSCDNPPCVNPAHLQSGTQAENVADMFRRGRANRARGERVRTAKLTAEIVKSIRSSYSGRRGEQVALARAYGVTKNAINAIVNGRTWLRGG